MRIDFPLTWDELTLPELKAVAVGYFAGGISRVELFLQLLGMRLGEKARQILPLLNPEDLAIEYSALTDFLIRDNDRTRAPRLGTGYTPADDFEDIRVGQFEEADVHLQQYMQTQDAGSLVSFIRALYRMDDLRSADIEVPDAQAAALYFLGCKSRLKTLFPLVFSGGDAGEGGKSVPDPLALTRLIHHSAGPRNGTREQIRAMLLKEFLFDCQLEAEKAPDVY
jgi:hypothetical protein